jgi:hypothetical protein
MIINFVITLLFILFMLWVGYWFLDWHQMDKTTKIGRIVADAENFFNHLIYKHKIHSRSKSIFSKVCILFDRLVVHVLNYDYVTGIKKLCKLLLVLLNSVMNLIKWINGKFKNKYKKV